MSEWQPIDSAPRDGTYVLLVSSGGAVWQGYWRKSDEAPYGHAGWTRFNSCDIQWQPNHWMPMPKPPTGA